MLMQQRHKLQKDTQLEVPKSAPSACRRLPPLRDRSTYKTLSLERACFLKKLKQSKEVNPKSQSQKEVTSENFRQSKKRSICTALT